MKFKLSTLNFSPLGSSDCLFRKSSDLFRKSSDLDFESKLIKTAVLNVRKLINPKNGE